MLRFLSPSGVGLGLLALAHAAFAWNSRDLRPDLIVIASPPSANVREATAFGDHQFLYRAWGLDLQNAGDTGGRATPMRNYNYDYVVGWLETLRALDPRADFHVFLAAHYFAQTPVDADARQIVEFIVRDAEGAPETKWPWLLEAAVFVERRLHDESYALSLMQRVSLLDFPSIPNWVLMFPATILEKLGRYPEARAVIQDVRQRRLYSFTLEDRQWVEDFLRRLPDTAQ